MNTNLFGIGPAELVFIAIIALIVLGPKRLPGAIREIGNFVRQMRELGRELTSQFSEELQILDEMNPARILDEATRPEGAKKPGSKKSTAAASKSKTTKPKTTKPTTTKPKPKSTTSKSATSSSKSQSAAADKTESGTAESATLAAAASQKAASQSTTAAAQQSDAEQTDAEQADTQQADAEENRIAPPELIESAGGTDEVAAEPAQATQPQEKNDAAGLASAQKQIAAQQKTTSPSEAPVVEQETSSASRSTPNDNSTPSSPDRAEQSITETEPPPEKPVEKSVSAEVNEPTENLAEG